MTSGASSSHFSWLRCLSSLELLGCLHLGLLGEVLNLCLTKHNVCVRGRVLVHVRLIDHKKDVLGLPDGHSRDSCHLLEAKLRHDLPRLFLATALLRLACLVSTSSHSSCCRWVSSSISSGLLQLRHGGAFALSWRLRVELLMHGCGGTAHVLCVD